MRPVLGRPAPSGYLAQDRLTHFGQPIVAGNGGGLARQRY